MKNIFKSLIIDILDIEDILDKMEFSRQGRERFIEKFIPGSKNLQADPEDEDFTDIYY